MSDVAIRVEGLGKRYRIGAREKQQRTLRETMVDAFTAPIRRVAAVARGQGATKATESFWALRNVTFNVAAGDVVGVVGRNGAGKSTLLKVLSRITSPTEGFAEIHGRVGSLLEVGTGFHPELTGRENVYLNGAILGMPRADIDRNFDEIVAFAEVEQFVDTAVKHYSSGMYLRLAFSVAAYLEPEILLVDEVLAVGDIGFQKKCLGKMNEVARQGRTVFFVSHNLEAVRSLCSRALVVHGGKIHFDGATPDGLNVYSELMRGPQSVGGAGMTDRLSRTSGAVIVTEVAISNRADEATTRFEVGETIRMKLEIEARADVPSVCLYVALRAGLTREVVTTFKHVVHPSAVTSGRVFSALLEIPDATIRPGDYSVHIYLADAAWERPYDVVDDNVTLPWLHIWSDETDVHRRVGYFSTPSRLTVTESTP